MHSGLHLLQIKIIDSLKLTWRYSAIVFETEQFSNPHKRKINVISSNWSNFYHLAPCACTRSRSAAGWKQSFFCSFQLRQQHVDVSKCCWSTSHERILFSDCSLTTWKSCSFWQRSGGSPAIPTASGCWVPASRSFSKEASVPTKSICE